MAPPALMPLRQAQALSLPQKLCSAEMRPIILNVAAFGHSIFTLSIVACFTNVEARSALASCDWDIFEYDRGQGASLEAWMRWSFYICYPQLSLFILFNNLPVLDLQLSVTLLTKVLLLYALDCRRITFVFSDLPLFTWYTEL
jgi:hypothetical protein